MKNQIKTITNSEGFKWGIALFILYVLYKFFKPISQIFAGATQSVTNAVINTKAKIEGNVRPETGKTNLEKGREAFFKDTTKESNASILASIKKSAEKLARMMGYHVDQGWFEKNVLFEDEEGIIAEVKMWQKNQIKTLSDYFTTFTEGKNLKKCLQSELNTKQYQKISHLFD